MPSVEVAVSWKFVSECDSRCRECHRRTGALRNRNAAPPLSMFPCNGSHIVTG
ncbi:MAG: hypothetical protein QOE20_2732 [Mycobacterium sp.]|jgi:hypothetical protein|nr:hypothetical protein [Mycobacterium sp.]